MTTGREALIHKQHERKSYYQREWNIQSISMHRCWFLQWNGFAIQYLLQLVIYEK